MKPAQVQTPQQAVDQWSTTLGGVIRQMVAYPDEVKVSAVWADPGRVRFLVRTHRADAGSVIGRGGSTARAIRRLMLAVGRLRELQFDLDIQGFEVSGGED